MNFIDKIYQTADKSGTLEFHSVLGSALPPGPLGYYTLFAIFTAPGAATHQPLTGKLMPPNPQQPRVLISLSGGVSKGYLGKGSDGRSIYAQTSLSYVIAYGAPTDANGIPAKLSLQHSFVEDTDQNSEKLSIGTPTDYILQN